MVSGVGHGSFLKFDVICDVVEPDSGVLDLVGFVEKVEDVSANTEAVGVAQQSADDKQTATFIGIKLCGREVGEVLFKLLADGLDVERRGGESFSVCHEKTSVVCFCAGKLRLRCVKR